MNKRFSDRIGITKLGESIQIDSMSKSLRNTLWNCFSLFYYQNINSQPVFTRDSSLDDFSYNLYMHYLGFPTDEIPSVTEDFIHVVNDYFYNVEWFDVYNFIQFTIDCCERCGINKQQYINVLNSNLENWLSGYRVVKNLLVPITNEAEIQNLTDTIQLTEKISFSGVKTHLDTAIQLLSTGSLKDSSNFRNSIKESISAVEALCNRINKNKSKGLDDALKLLNNKIEIHGALREGFKKLYGYTSDADGIRHSIMQEPNLYVEDAIYMLVTCSAFVNYIIQKAN